MPTVLITGANRGIGLEFAKQYAADGWNVISACRTPDKANALQNLAKKHPAVRIESLEVSDHESIKALAAKLHDMTIDVLINNAGIVSGSLKHTDSDYFDLPEQKFGSLDANGWLQVLKINTVAPLMISEAFLPHIARGRERKIIMISSRYGSIEMNFPDSIAYCSSKAALNMAMRKAALTLQSQQITVISFHPGWVQTDMGGLQAAVTTTNSVKGMRQIIANLTLKDSGQFLGYDGKVIPW